MSSIAVVVFLLTILLNFTDFAEPIITVFATIVGVVVFLFPRVRNLPETLWFKHKLVSVGLTIFIITTMIVFVIPVITSSNGTTDASLPSPVATQESNITLDIIFPKNNDTIQCQEDVCYITVEGAVRGISEDQEIWILIYPQAAESSYYPQDSPAVIHENGTWSSPALIRIYPEEGKKDFDIYAVVASKEVQEKFRKIPSFKSIPRGAKTYDSITVTGWEAKILVDATQIMETPSEPTPTPTLTSTPVPSSTPTPEATATLEPTNTPVIPTSTSIPTNTLQILTPTVRIEAVASPEPISTLEVITPIKLLAAPEELKSYKLEGPPKYEDTFSHLETPVLEWKHPNKPILGPNENYLIIISRHPIEKREAVYYDYSCTMEKKFSLAERKYLIDGSKESSYNGEFSWSVTLIRLVETTGSTECKDLINGETIPNDIALSQTSEKQKFIWNRAGTDGDRSNDKDDPSPKKGVGG